MNHLQDLILIILTKQTFLPLYKRLKKNISTRNIETAWKATGFIHFNPATVLRKLKAKKKYFSSAKVSSLTISECQLGIFVP